MPLLARGAALRFLLTRLVDWLNVPPGALVRPKDPIEYLRKLRFHQDVDERCATTGSAGDATCRMSSSTPTAPARGNPGPGGWGAILIFGDHEKELKGGEAQPPTTAWS